jgi:hypothetical protein
MVNALLLDDCGSDTQTCWIRLCNVTMFCRLVLNAHRSPAMKAVSL